LKPLWFKAVTAVVIGLLGLVLFLLPVAVLYFLEPGKGLSAALVIVFGIAFTVALSLVPGIRLDVILVGLSAYVAVLVAFLANFQGGQCQCSA
jgi:hypothetical protein